VVELDECPEAAGSPMVRAPLDVGGFCIDVHETTWAEYGEFLADIAEPPEPPEPPDFCGWNESFEPSEVDGGDDALPVVGVDFCDARAYCTWAGKRLCGAIEGGATQFDDFADAKQSQWQAACSRGGMQVFPYGNSYDAELCNGADSGHDGAISAGQSQCEGGYDGILDLSGNVWEWEDACDGDSGAADNCRLRGGEFSSPEGFLRCDYGDFSVARNFRSQSAGFRCCGN
jgi:formylglycine-generating enzyme required for sulfatase activity